MAKKDWKIENVNKGFADWIRNDSPYKGKSMNKATKMLKEDIVTGRYTKAELKNTLSRIEEMIYGKGKKKGML